VLRATLRLDRGGLRGRDGFRSALGVGIPLLVGLALDRPVDGMAAAGGAFSAGFAVFATGYRTRLSAVLLATGGVAGSTFVGVAVGDVLWAFALTATLWGFAAGMLVSLGVAAGIVGLQSVIGLLLVTQFSMPLSDGLGRAGLVLLGGLVQVVLLLTVWPLERSPVERRALAAVYRSLAQYAATLPDGHRAPPDSGPLHAARRALRDPQPFLRDDDVAVLSGLHEEAERVRTTLAALAHVREQLAAAPARADAVAALDTLAVDAAALLRDIAAAAELPRSAARARALDAAGPELAPERWARLTACVGVLREHTAAAGPARGHVGASLLGEVDRLATDLLGHLQTVVRLSRASSAPAARQARAAPWRDALPTLRANLTLRSPAFRHALRLAGALGAGTLLAALLPYEHRYWLPLTALVVLKPDFTSTFARGVGRIVGTVAGAVAASALAATLRPGPLLLAVLLVLAAWACYAVLFANYALYGLSVTAFVVFLLAFAGLPESSVVADRVEATVLGGALALVAYAVWPTWERVRVAEQLARALEAQARYGSGLLEQYADLGRRDLPRLEELRAAARVARTNAEASVERTRAEPARRRGTLTLDASAAVVHEVRSYALAALALQAHLPAARPVGADGALSALAVELRATLTDLAGALRDDRPPRSPSPLREARAELRDALDARAVADPAAALDAAVLDVETGQLVGSAVAVAAVLEPRPAPPRRRRRTGRARRRTRR